MSSYDGNNSFTGISRRSEAKALHSNKVKVSELIAETSNTKNLVVDNVTVTNGLTLNSLVDGSTLYRVSAGTISVNPGNIAAGARGSVDVTITGFQQDRIFLQPPSGLNAGLVYVGCDFTATNTVTIYLYNKSGSGVDDAALTWKYTVLQFSD